MRTLAILTVVVEHLFAVSHPVVADRIFNVGVFGNWGVAAFFVLSGFLLSPPYLRALLGRSDRWPSARLFLQRRFLRIVPLYCAAVIFSIAVNRAFDLQPISARSVIAHLLFLQNFVTHYVQDINGPLWTMPVDFEFYLALPVAAAAAAAYAGRRIVAAPLHPRDLVAMLGTVISASLAYRIIIEVLTRKTSYAFAYYVMMSNILGMATIFGLGIALALVVELRSGRPLERTHALLALGVALGFAVLSYEDALLPLALDSIFAAISVVALLIALPTFALARRVARSRVVAVAASLAYAVYLIHFPIVTAVWRYVGRLEGVAAFAALVLVTAAILVPIVYVAHRFIERPFLAMKDRKRETFVPTSAPG
ncbi:MAG: acyltransferase [Vulcanimicrobiaceae bacterium]